MVVYLSQDDVSVPGRPLSAGVTLEKISAHTVDGLGQEAFVKMNLMDILRKAVQLKRLAIYFDVDTVLWEPATDWADLQPGDWDALFLSGIAASAEEDTELGQPPLALEGPPEVGAEGGGEQIVDGPSGEAAGGGPETGPEAQRVYVLRPVDGRLSYLRRGREAQPTQGEARQEADLALQDISLQFSRANSPTNRICEVMDSGHGTAVPQGF